MTKKRIGPAFASEFVASGIGDVAGFSWGADGSLYGIENMTDAQLAALDALLAAHDPDAMPSPARSAEERLLDALVAEGVVPSAKQRAVLDRLRANGG